MISSFLSIYTLLVLQVTSCEAARPYVAPQILPSSVVDSTKTSKPEQIHLSYAGQDDLGSPSGITVTWFSLEPTLSPTVKFGLVEDALIEEEIAESVSYLEGHGFHHFATVTGLRVSKKYFYQCGGDGEYSEIFTFTTAPRNSDPVALSVFGDHGYLSAHKRGEHLAKLWDLLKIGSNTWDATYTRERLIEIKDQVDAFWHVGDIAYADDTYLSDPFGFNYEIAYNAYMNWMQPIMATKPYMVTPGNHELECHSPACLLHSSELQEPLSNFSAYNGRWHMPFASSKSSNNMWYSFNLGRAHFVAFNTETDYPDAPEELPEGGVLSMKAGGFGQHIMEQLDWLEQDLIAANQPDARALRPWVIVGGHRPIYDRHYLQGDPLQIALEGLLQKYRVDLYICGHKHEYFRTWPVFEEQYDASYESPTKPVYVVAGASGNDESFLKTEESKMSWWSRRFKSKYPGWLGSTVDVYSTGILRIPDEHSLNFQLISSASGAILDEFTITK